MPVEIVAGSEGELPDRPLGRTGLRVTPLCVGCAPLGNMPETFAYSVSEADALETIRTAFRGPIRFLDTAASYGDGESERRIGLVLRELGGLPLGYVLQTKADRNLQTGDFSGDQIKRSVDRLQVVYLHDPEHTSFENAMSRGGPVEVLQRFKDEGVIEHVGVAGGPVELMIRYVETGAFEAVITHNRFTLINRTAEPLIDLAAQRGLAVLNAAPYGSGILAKGPDVYARYAYQDAPPELVERVRRMQAICDRYGVPLAAAALQFSLRDPRIVSTIVGMSKPERIAQTIALARHPIPEAIWAELDAVGFETREDPERTRWQR
jgi:D-threo-aldose 1-dehydrogenase